MDDKEEVSVLIDKATTGDKEALEQVILSVRDPVFNLSLRMLGTFADAEDATQDILLKVITHLSRFKKKSALSTWVFRIATNHLINYKKHLFSHAPLTFEYYAEDIEHVKADNIPDLTQSADKSLLATELKLSCTNVMLQCLDAESRCIFVLGTMFKPDSRIAGEILGLTPEAYRQRLSRIRRKVADFLAVYCGEYGEGRCRCEKRLDYAVQSRRLDPGKCEYAQAKEIEQERMLVFKEAMEDIDELAGKFSFCKAYESPERTKEFFREFLQSSAFSTVKNF